MSRSRSGPTDGSSQVNELLVIVGFAILYFIMRSDRTDRSNGKATHESSSEPAPSREITEERIFDRESQFAMHCDSMLPDRPSRREMYIWQNFMVPWHRELAARFRYEQDKLMKIRQDWLFYMEAVEEMRLSAWMSLEGPIEKQEKYSERCAIARRQLEAIEEGFAAAIGQQAIDELKRARRLSEFDLLGTSNTSKN